MHDMRESVCVGCAVGRKGGTVPRVDADDGWLVEIQQVCFPPSNLESCQVRFVVMRRAHRSRQPLVYWMTSQERDKPVQPVVGALLSCHE